MRTIIALLAASVAFASDWSKTYTIGTSPSLEIRCDDGSLEFTRGSAGRIEVAVVTRGIDIKPGEVEIIESQAGDTVSIHIKFPRGMQFHFGGNRSVRVTVTAPPTLTLRAATGDGSIRATGLGGDIRLNSGDGSITGSGLDGMLEARTGDGTITIAGRFDALRASSGDGALDITADPGSKMSSAWSIDTGDGSIRVRLPRDLRADLDARTGDGSMNVNVPGLNVTSSGNSDRRGRLNGGGLPLKIRSGDGSVTISASR